MRLSELKVAASGFVACCAGLRDLLVAAGDNGFSAVCVAIDSGPRRVELRAVMVAAPHRAAFARWASAPWPQHPGRSVGVALETAMVLHHCPHCGASLAELMAAQTDAFARLAREQSAWLGDLAATSEPTARSAHLRISVTFLSSANGGRGGAIPATGSYRPQLWLNERDWDARYVLSPPKVLPGQSATADVVLMSPEEALAGVTPGCRVGLREGGRLVAEGHVIEVCARGEVGEPTRE